MGIFQREKLAEAVLELAWIPIARVGEYRKILERRLQSSWAERGDSILRQMDDYLEREFAEATAILNIYSTPVKVGENRYRIALLRANFSVSVGTATR